MLYAGTEQWMTKKFAFVSDFDGTLTDRDFYHIVMDKYLKDWSWNYYDEWKKSKKINVDFLNKMFGAMDRSEEEIFQDILELPLDPYAVKFIQMVQNNGGDFFILSAGTSYYINKLLEYFKIKNVTVISMNGRYHNRGIEIMPDPKSEFYSEMWGIDKQRVILSLKEKYEKVYFAGDSEPDIGAAKTADCAFATGSLKDWLTKEKAPYIAFEHFEEVAKYLVREKVFTDF